MASDVQISLGQSTSIVIDGKDITADVHFVGLQFEPGVTLPIVTLGVRSSSLSLLGESSVEVMEDAPPGLMVSAFLDTIDAAALLDEALEMDLDQPGGVASALIRKLKEKAHAWV